MLRQIGLCFQEEDFAAEKSRALSVLDSILGPESIYSNTAPMEKPMQVSALRCLPLALLLLVLANDGATAAAACILLCCMLLPLTLMQNV